MNKLNKQCYLFKCKTLVFHFSTYHPSLFEHLSHLPKSFCMSDVQYNKICHAMLCKEWCWLLSKAPSHWRTTDCTSVSDANFCPSSIFSIGPKDDVTGGQVRTVGRVWKVLMSTKNEQQHDVHYRNTSMATSPYLMFINDVIVTSS